MAAKLFIIHRSQLQFLFCLSLLTFPSMGSRNVEAASTAPAVEYRPAERYHYEAVANNTERRRILAPFQLCLLCKCCATSEPSNCNSMLCCFGIDCQLPDKPFGVCAFVPKSCYCTSCSM